MGDWAYIARKECGCIVMACVDNPDHRRDTAKEVAKAIRQGYIVERTTSAFVRENWLCPKHQAEETKKEVIERLKEGYHGENKKTGGVRLS